MTGSTPRGDRSPLERMLDARSVAVVGASGTEGSAGHQTLVELVTKGRFGGAVYPVNPKYEELFGHRCYASIADVPEPVDVAVISLANARLEEALTACADAGVASAVIYASGHEEPAEGVLPLTERLAAIARDADMAICGGNCMGFVNVERSLRATGWAEPERLDPGPIAYVSHSGSAFAALLHNDRGLRFNVAISAGQEFVTTVADYVRYALSLESTRAIGLFLEAVRDPDGFVEALRRADEADVPVVALKVGREALTKRMVAAHSGALAGEDGAFEAVFDAHGVARVESLDEMADALALFVGARRAGPGGLAAVHDSGGERALLVDSAAAAGVPLATISEDTSARMAALLDPGLPAVNPLDFWGTGRDAHEVVTGCVRALLEDPAVGAFAFAVDLTSEDTPDLGYIGMARETFGETEKPYAMVSNFSSGIDRGDVEFLEADGIPVLEGTMTGLAAFRHLFERRDHRALPPIDGSSPVGDATRARWRERLATGAPFDELEGLRLIADYGLPVVEAVRADRLEDAIAAAERIGFPLALKTAAPGITHKSDVGGVKLGIDDHPSLEHAYGDLERTLGPSVLVAAMAPAGVEIHLGVVRDEQFGPLVLAAAGGLLVEVLGDRRLAVPPLDESRARRAIDGLAIRPLLDGVRAGSPSDVDAVVSAIVAMSWLAHDLGDGIDAVDANPVICGRDGCVAVDALVIPKGSA